MAKRKSKAVPDGDDVKPKKARTESIPWASNPAWTHEFLTFMTDNEDFRRKLLGDSTQAAKKEKRAKAQGKEGKEVMFAAPTKYIFTGAEVSEEWKEKYLANTGRFVESTIQMWNRLRGTYSKHAKTLGTTGAGVKEGEAYDSALEKIQDEFPVLGRAAPNAHRGTAAGLFSSGKSSQAPSEPGDDGEQDSANTSDIDDEYARNPTSPIEVSDDDDLPPANAKDLLKAAQGKVKEEPKKPKATNAGADKVKVESAMKEKKMKGKGVEKRDVGDAKRGLDIRALDKSHAEEIDKADAAP
ncbi:hypothetical protein MKEN_01346300 [Mycena kentingensis (nom. inval.)]|nr:hypothetical protein MKEN_01346300 [Mycena kentingensis (nom. inval.)]